MKFILTFLCITICSLTLCSQQIDLLIKGGHLIDPKNGINELMDVAIEDGKVFQIAKNIERFSSCRCERYVCHARTNRFTLAQLFWN